MNYNSLNLTLGEIYFPVLMFKKKQISAQTHLKDQLISQWNKFEIVYISFS